MSDGRDSPSQSGLRDRVHFFEKVWSGQSSNDTVDATTDVSEIERRIEQRKRRPESPKIEVKLKHTRDVESPTKTFESSFPNLKLRHVEPVEEVERFERQVEEGDLAAGVRFVKFERVVKRTVTETREERAESPQHEWYSEYKQQTWQTGPRKEFLRSKSEYDSHIAEIRGKLEAHNKKNIKRKITFGYLLTIKTNEKLINKKKPRKVWYVTVFILHTKLTS